MSKSGGGSVEMQVRRDDKPHLNQKLNALHPCRAEALVSAASFLRLISDLVRIRQSKMIKTVTDIHRTARARSGAARVRVEADLTNWNRKQQGWKERNTKKRRVPQPKGLSEPAMQLCGQ